MCYATHGFCFSLQEFLFCCLLHREEMQGVIWGWMLVAPFCSPETAPSRVDCHVSSLRSRGCVTGKWNGEKACLFGPLTQVTDRLDVTSVMGYACYGMISEIDAVCCLFVARRFSFSAVFRLVIWCLSATVILSYADFASLRRWGQPTQVGSESNDN